MTPSDRLRAALDRLHWSGRSLAAILRRDERMVRRWMAGQYEPPPDVLAWAEMLAAFHTANPEPGQTSSKSRIQRLGAAVLAVPLPDEFPNRIAQIARLWAELHEADPDLANELAWRLPDTEIHRHD